MFKCTECERLYDIKPDYCDDCGNDVFEEIVEKIENTEETEKVIAKEPESAPKTETISELKIEKVESEKIKTDNVKIKRDIDYLSWSFLGICILISLYIIFFAWNPKELDETQQKPTETNKVNPNIPTSVNGFWNNEPPKVEVKPQITQPQVQQEKPQEIKPVAPQTQKEQPKIVSKTPEVKKPAAISKVQPQQVQKPVQKQTQQKSTQPQTQQKTAQQKAQQNTQAKPTQTTKPAQTTKPQTTTTPKTTTQKPTTTNTTPVWQSIQQTTPAQTTTKPTTTQTTQSQQTVNTAALKKELDNYKIALRNTIGRKIDFANVIGDGSCTVAFKIADSGKLTNRSFSQQSSNTTLNDAVYAAVMSTPSYNPPPSGYKGETLHLKITFYNGNFQISLN